MDQLIIKGNDNVTLGWMETVCVLCKDSKGAIVQKDGLEFSQTETVEVANYGPIEPILKVPNKKCS